MWDTYMPNYKTHVIFSLLPLPFVIIFMSIFYENSADLLPYSGFFGWWVLHTLAITPDIDTYSIPSKRLGPIGWVARTFSHHRGIFHSKIFWLVYFSIQYYFIGWWTLGGVCPIYCHLFLDQIVTGTKRYKNKMINKILR